MIDQTADRLQWEQNQLRDDLTRLVARVAELEKLLKEKSTDGRRTKEV